MARRKAAYRKRHQNRFSMFLVTPGRVDDHGGRCIAEACN